MTVSPQRSAIVSAVSEYSLLFGTDLRIERTFNNDAYDNLVVALNSAVVEFFHDELLPKVLVASLMPLSDAILDFLNTCSKGTELHQRVADAHALVIDLCMKIICSG